MVSKELDGLFGEFAHRGVDDHTVMSKSIKDLSEFNPLNTLLMNRWDALHKPNIICVNSNNPNKVIIAVLLMYEVFIGI